jgi:uncharacterized protein YjiK
MKKISLQRHWAGLLAIIALIAAGLPAARHASAQSDHAYVFLVREIELTELGVTGLEGLAYSPAADVLLAIQSQSGNGNRPVAMIDRIEELRGMTELQVQSSNVLNTAYNDRTNSLFIFDPATQELAATGTEPGGKLSPAAPSARYKLNIPGFQQAQGMDFEPGTGRLFILDTAGKRLWVITPDEAGNYDANTALRDNRVQRVDLKGMENGPLNGLAYNPDSGTLFTLNQEHTVLYEIAQNGELVSTRDVSSYTELKSPAEMVFAPTGDTTDDPAIKSLYIADPADNTIVELSITPDEVMTLQAASSISLVNTIDTSKWNPPSPDPSAVDYNHVRGGLTTSDSEVEEMSIYSGKNVFHSTLSGSLQSGCTTVAFNKEPAGNAIDPVTGNLFVSNDGKKLMHEATISSDGKTCALVRTVNMATYGVVDPEGIAVGEIASGQKRLFVADGTNKEVWVISPGPNGVFNGAGSSGDDVVLSHFDTAVLGLRDPEGIDYHPSRGTLFVVSRGDSIIAEISLTGTIQQVFNIGPFNIDEPAGIGIGPGSTNSNDMNIYLAARGLDNNDFPNENDGKIYELSISGGGDPPPTPTPTPTSGPLPDLIFADGFESGNFSAWSSAVGSDLSVTSGAALVGARGMQALINDNTAIYLIDESPSSESRYRARFYFDPNSIPMISGDNHFIFYGYSGTTKVVTRIQFRFTNSGGYQVRVQVLNNSSSWTNSAWFPISDAPHALEIDWQAAASGGLTFWVDGVQRAALTGIPTSNYRIERVRLGAVNGIDSGTRGTYYFDAFESRRQTYIGP